MIKIRAEAHGGLDVLIDLQLCFECGPGVLLGPFRVG